MGLYFGQLFKSSLVGRAAATEDQSLGHGRGHMSAHWRSDCAAAACRQS